MRMWERADWYAPFRILALSDFLIHKSHHANQNLPRHRSKNGTSQTAAFHRPGGENCI